MQSTQNTDSVPMWFWVSLAAAALLLGGALMVAALELGSRLAAGWLVVLFQILIGLIAVSFTTVIVLWCCARLLRGIIDSLLKITVEHRWIIVHVKERVPAVAASVALLAEGYSLITDKAFGGDDQSAIVVGLVLLIVFWLANECIVAREHTIQWLGHGLWVIGLLALPAFVLVHTNSLSGGLAGHLRQLEPDTLLVSGLSFLFIAIVPQLVKTHTQAVDVMNEAVAPARSSKLIP